MVNSPSQPFRTKHLIWFRDRARLTIEYSILKVKCVAVSGPASLEELVVGLMVRVPEFEPTIRIALRMPSERT
jgi:hypothetical protein